MNIVKGEKYKCMRGDNKGNVYQITEFLKFHISCVNLQSGEVEDFPKFYFTESFISLRDEKIEIDDNTLYNISYAVNNSIKDFVAEGFISYNLFLDIATKVNTTLMKKFRTTTTN